MHVLVRVFVPVILCLFVQVRVFVRPQSEIQTFYTTADVGETVGGYFVVFFGNQGPSRPIPANADPAVIIAYLALDLPSLGDLNVTKESYIYCACNNAFKWTITFIDLTVGVVNPLTIDSSGLTGKNAKIVGPTSIQDSSVLGGSLTLGAYDRVSRALSYAAEASAIQSALSDLGLSAHDIQIIKDADTLISGSRSWLITFNDYNSFFNIPLLIVDSSKLTGNGMAWAKTMREGVNGPTGLNGGFLLEWRGNVSSFLPYNCSASQMKSALEALPVINMVQVTRSLPQKNNGFQWTITFVEVNMNSPRGYSVQAQSNLEPIIPHNLLTGTNATIVVDARWGMNQSYNIFTRTVQGALGSGAGAVYVFQHVGDNWIEVARLTGSNTNEQDHFGGSVSIDNGVLVVGASSADSTGLPEVQKLHCLANNGSFTLSFRGWTTSPIYPNVTREQLVDAIVTDRIFFTKLHPINEVSIQDWGGGPLCNNNTAVITFYTPVDTSQNIATSGIGSNIELLTLSNNLRLNNSVSSAILRISEVRPGWWNVHGPNADTQQCGLVYVFRLQNCQLNSTSCVKSSWNQEALFAPINPKGLESFGQSVSISGNYIAVGAPGSFTQQGSVYIYKYSSSTQKWSLLQQIVLLGELVNGDKFGFKVAMQGVNLVIGTPGRFGGYGTVYLYKLSVVGIFTPAQEIVPNKAVFPLKLADQYGYSLSISGNLLVVGAIGRDDSTIYLGNTVNVAKPETGAVFVFERPTAIDDFVFKEKLLPSNVKAYDRFGWDIAIEGTTIVVGALQDYSGAYVGSKTVMSVMTTADYNGQPVGSGFRLKFQFQNDTGVWGYRTSRYIRYDTTAPEMVNILQNDLLTGSVLVSRSNVDVYNRGYVWSITFVDKVMDVPLLQADYSELTGTNASVVIQLINPTPPEVRSLTHIFQRANAQSPFTEEVFVFPYSHQPIDLCGYSVAISGYHVVVGCPNRDYIVPNQNSGLGLVFNTQLLNLAFSSKQYQVNEGNPLVVEIDRVLPMNTDTDILFYVETLDRNAGLFRQKYIADLYGINSNDITYPLTAIDKSGTCGSAVARSQYYGSSHNESAWVDGQYDYRAISDYVPVYVPRSFLSSLQAIQQTIYTTPDTILENPDEDVAILMSSPGLWPSILGKLRAKITILDGNDGFISNVTTYEKLYVQGVPNDDMHSLGYDVSVDMDVGVLVSGSPGSTVNKLARAGYVVLYVLYHNQWVQQKIMISPNPDTDNKFGHSVRIGQIYDRDTCILVIGEPGLNRAHVYSSQGSTMATTFTKEATLMAPTNLVSMTQHLFGARGTIALDEDTIVVGAPGIESIFIFLRRFDTAQSGWVWTTGALMRSKEYDYDMIGGLIIPHRMEFGSAVAMSGRTIVVGAPYADYDKLGSDLVEIDVNTEGTSILSFGRGKAYVFYILPAVQKVTILSSAQLNMGQFQLALIHRGVTQTTSPLSFLATSLVVKQALDSLSNIDSVSVTSSSASLGLAGFVYSWTITFTTEFDQSPLFIPSWNSSASTGPRCKACISFDASTQVTVASLQSIGKWQQQQALSASDR